MGVVQGVRGSLFSSSVHHQVPKEHRKDFFAIVVPNLLLVIVSNFLIFDVAMSLRMQLLYHGWIKNSQVTNHN